MSTGVFSTMSSIESKVYDKAGRERKQMAGNRSTDDPDSAAFRQTFLTMLTTLKKT